MKNKFNRKLKYIYIFSIGLICLVIFGCNDNKTKSDINDAIELTKNNKVIKDSLRSLKKRGIDFLVCYVIKNETHNILSFNPVQEPGEKFYTYNIDSYFEIETIEDVYVLYKDLEHSKIDPSKKTEKITKELLKKKLITFNGKNLFRCGDFIQFVFCTNDLNNFRCFNNRMEIDEQNRVHEMNMPYYRESFYPKCE
ncbi:MAG: hypothetical protein V4548_04590 [Bacteroidota bacterium]